jgi:hypothetical protein
MRKILILGAGVLAVSVAACATGRGAAGGGTATYGGAVATLGTPELTRDWPASSRDAAVAIEQRYGPPAETTATMLVWHRTGPWKRTVVHSLGVPHAFPWPHTDVVEQTVNYRAPLELFGKLAAFDGSIILGRTNGEVSVRCEREEMNFLALNLMNDIVTQQRTVDQARVDYARFAMGFANGERHTYTQGLTFQTAGADMRDPDRPVTPEP